MEPDSVVPAVQEEDNRPLALTGQNNDDECWLELMESDTQSSEDEEAANAPDPHRDAPATVTPSITPLIHDTIDEASPPLNTDSNTMSISQQGNSGLSIPLSANRSLSGEPFIKASPFADDNSSLSKGSAPSASSQPDCHVHVEEEDQLDNTASNAPSEVDADNKPSTFSSSLKMTGRKNRRRYQRQRITPHYALYAPPNPRSHTRTFMFMAIHSDPGIMYHGHELPIDEQVNRSIEHTCGMTVVCLNHTDPRNLYSEGLCTRTKWERVDPKTYSILRPQLIFRDKFYNYRNFRNMRTHVKWRSTALNQGSLNHPVKRDGSALPVRPYLLVNSMQSSYKFRPVAEFSGTPELLKNIPNGGRLHRFAAFYDALLRFMVARCEGVRHIQVYHRLPQNMLWLARDMRFYAANQHDAVMLNFIKLPASAGYPYISAHCLHRVNHNTITCEICLFESYLPALLSEINPH